MRTGIRYTDNSHSISVQDHSINS
uniref:Uncharacterized protein n=1 Tax=Arundo donax TaxID=35708 RepID=A0A0A9AFW6_ARUDO